MSSSTMSHNGKALISHCLKKAKLYSGGVLCLQAGSL